MIVFINCHRDWKVFECLVAKYRRRNLITPCSAACPDDKVLWVIVESKSGGDTNNWRIILLNKVKAMLYYLCRVTPISEGLIKLLDVEKSRWDTRLVFASSTHYANVDCK